MNEYNNYYQSLLTTVINECNCGWFYSECNLDTMDRLGDLKVIKLSKVIK